MFSYQKNLYFAEIFCYTNMVVGMIVNITGSILIAINYDFSDLGKNQNIQTISYALLIFVGAYFICLGILGIYAQKKKKNCAFSVYHFGVYFLMLVTLVSLIVMISTKVLITKFQDDTQCNKEDLMKDLKTTYIEGKKLLCTPKCPCKAEQSLFSPSLYSTFYISRKGARRVDECDDYEDEIDVKFYFDYNDYDDYLENLVHLLRLAEQSFDCSGFCSTNTYYVFRNMNDGTPVPGRDCKQKLLDFISKNIVIAIIITSIITAYMLLVTYFSIRVMFSKEKRIDGSYYNQKSQQQQQEIVQIPNQNENIYQNNNQIHPQNIYDNNFNNNIYQASQPTKINNSVSCINGLYPNIYQPQYQNQKNINYVPAIPETQNIQEIQLNQDIQHSNQPHQKYPQIYSQQANQPQMDNIPPNPSLENAKYAKY